MRSGLPPAAIVSALFLTACFLCGCATSLGDRQRMTMHSPAVASPYLGDFEILWGERTITLMQEEEGRRIPSPDAGGAEPSGGGLAFFPLIVRATYMDSALIAAGLSTFAHLASMTEDEETKFRSTYATIRPSGDSTFIWLEIRTSATEEYLKLDRWTLILENEDGRQIEPGRIVEHPVKRQAPAANEQAGAARENSGFGASAGKAVQLYFGSVPPASRMREGTSRRTLRIAMLETKNPAVRVEGSWQISGSSVERTPR